MRCVHDDRAGKGRRWCLSSWSPLAAPRWFRWKPSSCSAARCNTPKRCPSRCRGRCRRRARPTAEMTLRCCCPPAPRPAHSAHAPRVLRPSAAAPPAVPARLAAGERLISAPGHQPGERLVDAVAMMDKLRTARAWGSEQTHDSLRRFLLEETYELFDAVHSGDTDALRDELGDVLLQVLFHARIAEDAPEHPFTIDDVADALLRKLGNRAPGVLAGETISLDEQLAQWEERKALEKPRNSVVDDVPTGQPALALAHKVIQRVTRAGLPLDLIPTNITSITVTADVDAENALRTAVLEVMDTVRGAEKAIAADRRGEDVPAELDVAAVGAITEEGWGAHR